MICQRCSLTQYLQLAADSYKRGQEGTEDQTESAPEQQNIHANLVGLFLNQKQFSQT